MSGRRILLLIPHPDDEVVGCAAGIARARAGGAEVFALYLTTGVPTPASQWPWSRRHHDERVHRRRQEALAAAAALGIEPVELSPWPARQLKDHLGQARELIQVHVKQCAAQALWTPAYEGGHQDHDATNFLAGTFADELSVVEFAEYNAAGGRVHTNAFPRSSGAELVLELDPVEATHKERLLSLYASERANLKHVGRGQEAFRLYGGYDYTRPAHEGPLFYERFHWVPFRHPRIDFTRSSEVSAALSAFQHDGKWALPMTAPTPDASTVAHD